MKCAPDARRFVNWECNVAASTLSGTSIDMGNRGLADLVSASVHYYNTEQEIAQFCATIEAVETT
ncbi:hypothetical protein KBI23_27490 [bacterium]|nr:hypothetical protein [bacterium]MBP9807704.1 hypothetical protein [bacterium]